MIERLRVSRAAEIRQRIAEVSAHEWRKCPACGSAVFQLRLRQLAATCPECGHHFPVSALERIEMLVDRDTFTEYDHGLVADDRLGFVDAVPYPERLTVAAERTGIAEAARYGTARIGGLPVVVAALEVAFLGGTVGYVVGEKVTRAAELALATGTPLVVCCCSTGARLQEGGYGLLQAAKTAAALHRLAAAGVPYVCVLCDQTYGPASASFAGLGDVVLAEPGARRGLASPQAVEQASGQRPAAGFQQAESLLAGGQVDAVVPRPELPGVLARVLRVHAAAGAPVEDAPTRAATRAVTRAAAAGPVVGDDAWETLRLAREPGRPHLGDLLGRVFEEFVELRGDRWREDDPAVVGGLALLAGAAVVVVGHRRGRGTVESLARNHGMPHPAGHRKAARLLRYAERFGLPVVSFVDTPGAYPGERAEQENPGHAIAANLALLAGLRVPVVCVVLGEASTPAALAFGVGDRLLMLANSTYSVASPEAAASALFQDARQAPELARALRLTAADLLGHGIADEVLAEPPGGAHTDHEATAAAIRDALVRHLGPLRALPVQSLLDQRQRRLREAA